MTRGKSVGRQGSEKWRERFLVGDPSKCAALPSALYLIISYLTKRSTEHDGASIATQFGSELRRRSAWTDQSLCLCFLGKMNDKVENRAFG